MIKFGPSGNSDSFYKEGFVSSFDMPKWLFQKNMEIFEYSFGRGTNISAEASFALGIEAQKYDIELTAHAPYYINFASNDDIIIEKSFKYILSSLERLKLFGGKRLVFHCGSPVKSLREPAFERVKKNLKILAKEVRASGYNDFILCPETMGKINQIGNLNEIEILCSLDDMFVPCIDWGHVNARMGGVLTSDKDYTSILYSFMNAIGEDKTKVAHMHFSHIEFSKMGEVKHLTNSDIKYGPYHENLINAIVELKLEPYILSESAGTQIEDITQIKDYYNSIAPKQKTTKRTKK